MKAIARKSDESNRKRKLRVRLSEEEAARLDGYEDLEAENKALRADLAFYAGSNLMKQHLKRAQERIKELEDENAELRSLADAAVMNGSE